MHTSPPFNSSPIVARLEPLTEADMDGVAALGRTIWLDHYVPIIGSAQVEYMLAQRFSADYFGQYLNASDRWFDVLRANGEAVGYCSYALTDHPNKMKLEQLYLRSDQRGQGLGGLMMRRVESHARARGCDTLVLTVNKHNRSSIDIYERAGFVIRKEVLIDIGQGYAMDDYVMEKTLG